MVLESTMICVDNSDYMRNGDFLPTRLQAQQDAVNLVCHSKTRSNPENNVGLITLANVEVLATLTSDVGRILSKLHQVQPNGNLCLITGIRIAHLALKHRQGKNHKMRIVAFVGSPVQIDEKELVKLAKRLKKEKVNVDIISFGEESINNDVLTAFINALNGKDGTGSHLVTVPPGPHLSDALISSPIIQGEDGMGGAGMSGAAFEFGVDPNEDPELALALRVSMEEQRQRQEDEARRAQVNEDVQNKQPETIKEVTNEEAMLKRALAMSLEGSEETTSTTAENTAPTSANIPDFANMSEEEQIAFAMQMSMQDQQDLETQKEEAMEVEEDYSAVMSDAAFLQSVLENLPGVDPQSETVLQAVGSLQQNKDKDKEKDKDKDKDKTKEKEKDKKQSDSTATVSLSELRFPLMWKDLDHFKNRGDYRRFAVFCMARIGTEICDTILLCPIDRTHTDITFVNPLIFNNVPAEFELKLEIYSCMLEEDFSIASTPLKITKTIHSSISKTLGKRLSASLNGDINPTQLGPRFELAASAKLTIEETDNGVRTHDLVINHVENKNCMLPLFGYFCCRLAVQPECINSDIYAGIIDINSQKYWARLRNFSIKTWFSRELEDEEKNVIHTIPIDKDTIIQFSKHSSRKLLITNFIDGIKKTIIILLKSNKEALEWMTYLTTHSKDHNRWKSAGQTIQRVQSMDNIPIFCNNRQGSLYDETSLIESIPSSLYSTQRFSVQDISCTIPSNVFGNTSNNLHTRSLRNNSMYKLSSIGVKHRWSFLNKDQS